MLEKLVRAVALLERNVQASPLHKMHASHLIGATRNTGYNPGELKLKPDPDPTMATFLFRDISDMETARTLEDAYAARGISTEDFCEQFPNVPFVAVNVHYDVDGLPVVETPTSEGITLIRPDLQKFINELTIELCLGAKVTYIPDDDKIEGDVVVGVTIAHTGTVAHVYRTYRKPPFSFRSGTGVLDVFQLMESYVMTHGRVS